MIKLRWTQDSGYILDRQSVRMLLSLLCFSLFLTSCLSGPKYKYSFEMISPASALFTHTDDVLSIMAMPTTDRIQLVIANKSLNPVKIIWDQSAYVDVNGLSHRVVHEGIKLAEKEASQPPTVIPQGSKVIDSIIPSDYIFWTGSIWRYRQLFPNPDLGLIYDPLPDTRDPFAFKEQSFRLFLAVDIDNQIKNYAFVLKITNVEPIH